MGNIKEDGITKYKVIGKMGYAVSRLRFDQTQFNYDLFKIENSFL